MDRQSVSGEDQICIRSGKEWTSWQGVERVRVGSWNIKSTCCIGNKRYNNSDYRTAWKGNCPTGPPPPPKFDPCITSTGVLHYRFLQLFFFFLSSKNCIFEISGCTNDVVRELYVNKNSTHALCISPSQQSNSSEIAVWNLDTDEHKHMAKHPQVSGGGALMQLH